ncbi:MAG: hypothetical protein ACYCVZ_00655 [Streptosporangiaceae bacterium]
MHQLPAAAGPRRRGPGALESWALGFVAAGLVLLAAAVVLDFFRYRGATVAQLASFCSSGVGELAQGLSRKAAGYCGWASLAHEAIGWLIGAGVALLIGAAVLAFLARLAPAPAVAPTLPGPVLPLPFCGWCGRPWASHDPAACPGVPPSR